jgi:hypothetical protein
MAFPMKVCVVCEEEFELRPGKPGFANRCPECSEPENNSSGMGGTMTAAEKRALDEERRAAMKNLLYRKDS